MCPATLPRIPAFVLLASCLLVGQQQTTTPPSPSQTNPPAQDQATNPSPPAPTPAPTKEPAEPTPAQPAPAQPAQAQPPTAQPRPSESGQQAAATPKSRQSPKAEAWQILDDACTGNRTITRAMAIRVLGLMP